MRLTLELLHHRLTVAIEHDDPKPERHEHPDLDALVERSGNDRDPFAELDHRPRMGFRP